MRFRETQDLAHMVQLGTASTAKLVFVKTPRLPRETEMPNVIACRTKKW